MASLSTYRFRIPRPGIREFTFGQDFSKLLAALGSFLPVRREPALASPPVKNSAVHQTALSIEMKLQDTLCVRFLTDIRWILLPLHLLARVVAGKHYSHLLCRPTGGQMTLQCTWALPHKSQLKWTFSWRQGKAVVSRGTEYGKVAQSV